VTSPARSKSYRQALAGGTPGDTFRKRAQEKLNRIGRPDRNEGYKTVAFWRSASRAITAPAHLPRATAAAEVELERAMTTFRHGDFRRAQLLLQRLTSNSGGPARSCANRLLSRECAFQLGEHAQAATDFRKVAADSPRPSMHRSRCSVPAMRICGMWAPPRARSHPRRKPRSRFYQSSPADIR